MALLGKNPPQNSLFQCPTFFGVAKPSISESLILRRIRHSKFSFASIFVSSSLRYAPLPLVCCNSSSSSDECNMASSAKIFMKGLPQSISEGRLMKVFSEYGEISQVDLPLDRESRQPLGYAYIWFQSEASAQLAVKEINGKLPSPDQEIGGMKFHTNFNHLWYISLPKFTNHVFAEGSLRQVWSNPSM